MDTILIVEDDKALNRGIALSLKHDDIKILQAYDIASAWKFVETHDTDLVILDINLPDGSGLDFCKQLKESRRVPVLFLTANDMETDILTGFEMGGDDYVTKPFSLMILRARVMAALRRRNEIPDNKISVGGLVLDFETSEFSRDGMSFQLSRTEQKLLRKLIANKGIILSRDNLMESVWSNESDFVDENALTVTVKRLRSKIEDNPAQPVYIKTVYGLGYLWTGGASQ